MAGLTLADARARRALESLHDKELNFDPYGGSFSEHAGWRIDAYCQPLPPEEPGPPVPGGSWERARGVMRDYEFADPDIVRAVYLPETPLDGRNMLLELRFHGLRFFAGVRVGGVHDESVVRDGREVRVWGWNYRTLQGHLEIGQMDYEVGKWLDDGTVEFRILAVSRPAAIPNPLVRLGFLVFGRREQLRFARHACERMERLVRADLESPPAAAPRIRAERLSD